MISRFEELIDNFLRLDNNKFIRLHYSTKFILIDRINFSNTDFHYMSGNYLKIQKHYRANGLFVGVINQYSFVPRESVKDNFDYINLIKVFNKYPRFLIKVNNLLEKEFFK